MRHYRVFALGVAAALAFGAQSLAGRAAQPSAAAAASETPFDHLHFRSIGPAGMSGRIADIAVYEANPNIFYVGAAHGGVWKTINGGTTFDDQLQHQGLMSIGDIAVAQNNPDVVWVGTGESNNRQSTSWGDGVFKSIDGGKTYTNVGLETSRHINRIVIDPRNTDVVFVAATGPLFGPGGERGVYKTTDGGRTWKQVLKGDDDTGANDLVIDPSNSRILYASMYQRRRTACCMNGGGPGSGIWKSTDAGETWTRLTKGLPEGSLGRIGLDVYRRRPNILYALVEGPVPPAGEGRGGGGGGRGTATGVDQNATGLYRSDDSGASWRKVNNENARPMYFSQVRVDPNDPEVVFMGGVKLHLTTDGGKTISTNVTPTAHDDVHAIWIDPSNSQHVMIGDDGGLAATHDQAKTWEFFPNLPVGLFYHVSVDMANPYNVCGGMQDNYDWCGPSSTRSSAGIGNYEWKTLQGGDGFVVLQDPRDQRVIYSETQDGNIVRVDRVTNETQSIRPVAPSGEPAYRWHWDTPMILSPHDPAMVYVAAQKVFRSTDRGLSFTPISGDLTSNANREDIVTMGLKGSDIRIAKDDGIVAWPTIVALSESPRRAGVIYAGTDDGNLQVTKDAGKTWTNVYDKLPNAPKGAFVSRIAASRYDDGAAYVTVDDHRQNNYGTYVYATGDYGQTWKSLKANLPSFGEVVVKAITEDQKNPDVLYLGTETGLFISVDRGASWIRPRTNLPDVRVDEITLHPRDNAMILATHGRALWILDHLEPIQEYAAAAKTDAKLFTPAASMYRRPARDRNYEFWGDQTFFGENPPEAAMISWYQKQNVNDVALKITDAGGRTVREISGPVLAKSKSAGIQTACWDLRVEPIPAPPAAGRGGRGTAASGRSDQPEARGGGAAQTPQNGNNDNEDSGFGAGCGSGGGGFGGFGGGGGASPGPFVLAGTYNVALVVDGKTVDTKPLRVTSDPQVVLTEAQRKQLFDEAMELHQLQKGATDAASRVTSLNRQTNEIAQSLESKSDVPAEVKTSFEAFRKEVNGMAPKYAAGGGRGGFGRGNAEPTVLGKLTQAKNGLMGGMWPTEQTLKSYREAKAETPKAVADANALFAKAKMLGADLAKYNVTLTAPEPVSAPDAKK
ncbi:MAG TPA: hypothetical protein VL262_16505 [Vicinamibacterales bacterium]|nr:hypothetical protein [Vicinamibacterales bacterium]